MSGHRTPVLLLLAAITAAGCAGLGAEESAERARGVTVPALRADFEVVVWAFGELESEKASPIAVPKVPTGALTIKELVPEGSVVEEGAVVVVFDETKLEIELANQMATSRSTRRRIDRTHVQAAIETGSIEVMREVAELELGHAEAFDLSDETIYSRLELLEYEIRGEDAEATIVFADASLRLRGEYYEIDERILGVERGQAEGKIDRVQASLGNLVLKTPIGGMVRYKSNWRGSKASVGDSLWPGNVVMSIVDPRSVSLKAFILESEATGVTPGTKAVVRIDARPEREFQGEVQRVAELSRPIQRGSPVKYFEVVVSLDDADPALLKPGMKGEARIMAQRVTDAIVIPRSALRGDEDDFRVMLSTPTGAVERAVRVGPRDRVRVVVEEGLAEGDLVLLGSAGSLAPPAARTPGA